MIQSLILSIQNFCREKTLNKVLDFSASRCKAESIDPLWRKASQPRILRVPQLNMSSQLEIAKHTQEQATKQQSHRNSIQHDCNGTPLQYSCLENPMDGGAG